MPFKCCAFLRQVATILLLAVLLCGSSCTSGPSSAKHPSIAPPPTQLGSLPPSAGGIAKLKAQLISAQVPDGVDPGLWQQLKSALLDDVERFGTAREVSVLPDPVRGYVDDLQFVDDGAGGFDMFWSYNNPGDYDVNGEVNLADLAAVGANFHRTQFDENWDGARQADGDGNGEVNLADVTPIGANFSAQALGYRIYGSDTDTGPWTLIDSVALSEASGPFPPSFQYALGLSPYPWILLSPYDSEGADWVNGGGGGGTPVEVFNDFNAATEDVTQATNDYTRAFNDLAGASPQSLSVEQINTLIDNFISKGFEFVAAGEEMNASVDRLDELVNHGASRAASQCPQAADFIPTPMSGIGAGSLKATGDLAQSNLDKVEALKQKYPNHNDPLHPDHQNYKNECIPIMNQMAKDGTGLVLGSFAGAGGTLAGGLLGAALTEAGILGGGILTVVGFGVGGGVIAGVGFGIYWVYSSSGESQSLPHDHGHGVSAVSGDALYSAAVGNGESFPAPSQPGGTLVISVPGYAPAMFRNFQPPAPGQKLELEVQLAEVDAANPYSMMSFQCTEGAAVSNDCADIIGLTLAANPPDPGPGQGVTVTGTLLPAIVGCSVSFTVSGTDGYAKAETVASDANGQISFSIPGGAEGVRDAVQVTADATGTSTSLVYVF